MAKEWLTKYVNDPGFMIGTATTEPETGSENQLPYNGPDGGYRVSAVRDGDDYVVDIGGYIITIFEPGFGINILGK